MKAWQAEKIEQYRQECNELEYALLKFLEGLAAGITAVRPGFAWIQGPTQPGDSPCYTFRLPGRWLAVGTVKPGVVGQTVSFYHKPIAVFFDPYGRTEGRAPSELKDLANAYRDKLLGEKLIRPKKESPKWNPLQLKDRDDIERLCETVAWLVSETARLWEAP